MSDKDRVDEISVFSTDNLLAWLRLVFVNHLSGMVYDLENGNRRNAPSAIGEDGESARHLDQADIAAAQASGTGRNPVSSGW